MSQQPNADGSPDRAVDRGSSRTDSTSTRDDHEPSGPIIVGIPAYNEERTIGTVVLLVREHVDEVVVVDDGSTDRTATVARRAGATVIRHEENRGKGAAIRSFIDHVREREFEVCVLFDGDGQHSHVDIPRVVEPVLSGDADLVIGSRFVDGGTVDSIPLYRRFGQRVLDAVTSLPSRTRLTDTQSGFRALSPKAIRVMSTSASGYGIESEMIDIASREQLSIDERPIEVRYDDVENTRHPVVQGFQVLWLNLALLRDRSPFAYVGGLGILFVLSGLVAAADLLVRSTSAIGIDHVQLLFAHLLVLVGVLCLFSGVFVKLTRTRKTAQDST